MLEPEGLQSKIGSVLTIILVVCLTTSLGITSYRSRRLLVQQQEDSLESSSAAAFAQARSVFQSLRGERADRSNGERWTSSTS